MTKLTKEERIKRELARLVAIFSDLDTCKMATIDGLIKRAAYMRITLEDFEADIDTNGYVESFSQSDKLDSYDRGRPVVGFYNTMLKNYQVIMKQLIEALPDAVPEDASAEINKFLGRTK